MVYFKELFRSQKKRIKKIIGSNVILKGGDRLCKVVELSMYCCGTLLLDSFETY